VRELVVTKNANRDIEQVYLFGITNYGLSEADKYIDGINNKITALLNTPFLGTKYISLSSKLKSTYKVYYKSHIIFYQITQKQIVILAVLRGERDVKNVLSQR
jgi:toxin ParE1/3/4